ncbi:hypothetical protein [Hoeflea sp. EC-HK425]|uniref:hypothetical protein n=1 Tax=Hoeflea sp. EC-HK425 TaxID=2038388 RepID=UPI0012542176|nr:hypothetical protein [Hoeflea sp. EC-HK425]VVT16127.1 conserved hypothetical protein [Hoeflea sp. EC-HK425]
MDLSAPINELKSKAKLLRRETGIPHNQALDRIARDEGFASWSILIRKYEDQKPRPAQKPTSGYPIKSLPIDSGYRTEAIEFANSKFEDVVRRIEPGNPLLTAELWNAAEYVDNHHLRDDMLPIDSEYALSLIESSLVHYVIGLATKADEMAREMD